MLHSYICPVCNGLAQLMAECRQCGALAEDCGKLSDFYGPYAPYRPIDDLKLTNGYNDAQEHLCIHSAYCASCQSTMLYAVEEV